ncbi:MAG: AMP-binding protein [Gemmatimonadetes bacterium]|nr:AMP-binding protein [Gemmatimonadota bacterium]
MATPRTLNELFFGSLDRFGTRPVVLRAKRGGAWRDIGYAEVTDTVRCLAAGLRELGVVAGSNVAILSENRPEWAFVDFACLTARCADVPIYPTLPAGQISYILRDSGAVAVFVSSKAQLEKILSIRQPDVTPALRHIIAMDDDATGPGVMPFADLVARGRAALGKYPRWREEALEASPDDLATLIYTSGTTGDPKGVMLTHGNLTSNVVGGLQYLDLRTEDSCLSFLPLSHVFERMAGHYLMLQRGHDHLRPERREGLRRTCSRCGPRWCCRCRGCMRRSTPRWSRGPRPPRSRSGSSTGAGRRARRGRRPCSRASRCRLRSG